MQRLLSKLLAGTCVSIVAFGGSVTCGGGFTGPTYGKKTDGNNRPCAGEDDPRNVCWVGAWPDLLRRFLDAEFPCSRGGTGVRSGNVGGGDGDGDGDGGGDGGSDGGGDGGGTSESATNAGRSSAGGTGAAQRRGRSGHVVHNLCAHATGAAHSLQLVVANAPGLDGKPVAKLIQEADLVVADTRLNGATTGGLVSAKGVDDANHMGDVVNAAASIAAVGIPHALSVGTEESAELRDMPADAWTELLVRALLDLPKRPAIISAGVSYTYGLPPQEWIDAFRKKGKNKNDVLQTAQDMSGVLGFNDHGKEDAIMRYVKLKLTPLACVVGSCGVGLQ